MDPHFGKPKEAEAWSLITPVDAWWDLKFGEIWQYRYLLFLFVKRDFVAVYKQTILGPIWFFLQPILATIIYTFVFGNIAEIPTDGIPKVLFFLLGITIWNYFSECLLKTAQTFSSNSHVFEKVYFPRLLVPLSIVFSNLMKFALQFVLFLGFYFYFVSAGVGFQPNLTVLLFPFLIFIMAGLGIGLGLIVASLTTKYRDMQFLVTFVVQLMMYATPIVYPLSLVPHKFLWILLSNPMTSVIETAKYALLGRGVFNPLHLFYSFSLMVCLTILGLVIFHRVERNFIDTI